MTDFIRLSTFDVLGFSGIELTVFLARVSVSTVLVLFEEGRKSMKILF